MMETIIHQETKECYLLCEYNDTLKKFVRFWDFPMTSQKDLYTKWDKSKDEPGEFPREGCFEPDFFRFYAYKVKINEQITFSIVDEEWDVTDYQLTVRVKKLKYQEDCTWDFEKDLPIKTTIRKYYQGAEIAPPAGVRSYLKKQGKWIDGDPRNWLEGDKQALIEDYTYDIMKKRHKPLESYLSGKLV